VREGQAQLVGVQAREQHAVALGGLGVAAPLVEALGPREQAGRLSRVDGRLPPGGPGLAVGLERTQCRDVVVVLALGIDEVPERPGRRRQDFPAERVLEEKERQRPEARGAADSGAIQNGAIGEDTSQRAACPRPPKVGPAGCGSADPPT